MKRILIAGPRTELHRIFEQLLWQEERQFIKATNPNQCFELARRTNPDLIIVDSEIAETSVCHELVVDLKRLAGSAGKPLLLIAEPQQSRTFKQLLEVVDGVLPEPFSSTTVKAQTESYLH